MKKIGLLIAVLMIASCAKTERTQNLVTVTLNIQGVEQGAFAKASTADEVNTIISSALPTSGVSLTLKNTLSNVSYTATTGTAVTLPVGDYTVTGRYKPSDKGDYNGAAYLSIAPLFSVSTTLTVVAGTSDYLLPITWQSFALCCDATEVASWTWKPFSGTASAPTELTEGDTKLFFVCGTIASGTLQVELTPSDLSAYSTTTWQIATTASNVSEATNGICAEYGKWYRLHPDGVVTESGTIGFDYSDWTCGQE